MEKGTWNNCPERAPFTPDMSCDIDHLSLFQQYFANHFRFDCLILVEDGRHQHFKTHPEKISEQDEA